MTVELPVGPGVPTWTSTRYTATVNGSACWVSGYTQTLRNFYTAMGTGNVAYEQSTVKVGTNETVAIEVTRIAGAITSYELEPPYPDVTAAISAGKLQLSVPAGRFFQVRINGDMGNILHVVSNPVQDAVPVGAVEWSTSGLGGVIPNGTKLKFSAGVHTLPSPFIVGSNVTIHVDRNAVVDGNYYFPNSTDCVWQGNGNLVMTSTTSEAVFALGISGGFAAVVQYVLFCGYSLVGEPLMFQRNNIVRGVTILKVPFFAVYWGINQWIDCHYIEPYHAGASFAFAAYPHPTTGDGLIDHCYGFTGDDCFDALPYCNLTIRDSLMGTTTNGCIVASYWADETEGATTTVVEDCDFFHLGLADTDTDDTYVQRGGQTILHAEVDGYATERLKGRFNFTMRRCKVWGRIRSRFCNIATKQYPYTPGGADQLREGQGQIAGFHFEDLEFELAPEQPSIIAANNRENAPHRLYFDRVTIAGEKLKPHNFLEFFELDSDSYRVYVAGHPMVTEVDICNQALSLLGDVGQITSIDPPDGSAQALVCNRFYDQAIDATLQMHAWSFAIKHEELVAATNDRDEWAYAYEVPDGLLRVLFVLPETTRQDFPDQFSEAGRDYAIELDADDAPILYTNMANARIRFIKRITNEALFSPLFIQAAAAHLASLMAGAIIKGNEGMAVSDRCLQRFSAYLGKAAQHDSKQRVANAQYQVPWHAARN